METAQRIREAIAKALAGMGLNVPAQDVPLEFPADITHGDFASGVALARAKEAGMNPRALAEKLVTLMGSVEGVAEVEIAGPGFINFTLAPEVFAKVIEAAQAYTWGNGTAEAGKQIVFEYTDPNPFKAFHIGHLMSNAIGESLSRLAESQGANVVRANYQGDVGVHVACALWGIRALGIHPESADEFGRAYAVGASAYREDPMAKGEIDAINQKLYDRTDPQLNELYDTGRRESLAAFEKIYATLGTKFDRYYFESETAPIGKEIVLAHPDIFPLSEGARIFRGEEYGLHTRVFLNAKGIPTYEAKELGLEKLKQDEYPDAAAFVIITANEVSDYFRVVKKAMELVYPDIAKKLRHVAHGMMKLPTGKMSSRTGDVITGESLLRDLAEAALERATESRADNPKVLAEDVAVGAIKFQVLKQGSAKDIVFDPQQALSLEGDSGPYLQYTYARTRAIARKAKDAGIIPKADPTAAPHNTVARLVARFPSIVERAAREFAPHHVAQYLLELAGVFNSWYAQEQILDGTPAAAHKLALAGAAGNTIRNGLWLLGIAAPEKM